MTENKKTPQEVSREELYLKLILEQTLTTNRHFLIFYILAGVMLLSGIIVSLVNYWPTYSSIGISVHSVLNFCLPT